MRRSRNTLIHTIFSSIIMVVILLCYTIQVQAAQDGYFTYIETGTNQAEITGYTGPYSNVEIPENIGPLGMYKVTSIGDYAFQRNTSITSVSIPIGVTKIGDWAFYACHNLSNITMPGVTEIGYAAINGCAVTNIEIPEGLTTIKGWAFAYCQNLTSIVLPNGVSNISDSAFLGCNKLTNISMPGVKNIGPYAFYYNTSLTSITIPGSTTNIELAAFQGCSSLSDVYYCGSESQWNAIAIGSDNENLVNAMLHFGDATSTDERKLRQLKVIKNAQDIYQDLVDRYGSVANYCVVVSSNKYYNMKTLYNATNYELNRNYVINYSAVGMSVATRVGTLSYVESVQSALGNTGGVLIDELTKDSLDDIDSLKSSDYVYTQAFAGGNQQDISGLMELGFIIEDEYDPLCYDGCRREKKQV